MAKRRFTMLFVLLLVLAAYVLTCRQPGVQPTGAPRASPKIIILMYHKVEPSVGKAGLGLRVPVENFEQQMEALAKLGYQSVSLDEVANFLEDKGDIGPKSVVVTFDDGYLDNYTWARPIMLKYNFRGTIFLVSDQIGRINQWDAARGRKIDDLLGDKEIRTMLKEGFQFGAHTKTHVDLKELSTAQARLEILGSKLALEARYNIPFNYFCYPYGRYNKEVVAITRASGYRAALTTAQGEVEKGDNIFTLKRIRVTGHLSRKEFLKAIGE